MNCVAGACYTYGYTMGDFVYVMLQKVSGNQGRFVNLDASCREARTIDLFLNDKFLALCGPEEWRARIHREQNAKRRDLMSRAYMDTFDTTRVPTC